MHLYVTCLLEDAHLEPHGGRRQKCPPRVTCGGGSTECMRRERRDRREMRSTIKGNRGAGNPTPRPSRMTGVLAPAWTSPIYGLRTRNRHPSRNLLSSLRTPSGVHHTVRRPVHQDGRMAGDGDLRSFNPHPPLLHLHQTRESMTPASPEIRNQTALLLRKQPSGADLNARPSGRYCKLAVSPLPPGANPPCLPTAGARLSRRRGHRRPPRTQSALRRVGSYDVLPPLPRPSPLAGYTHVHRHESRPGAPRSGSHS